MTITAVCSCQAQIQAPDALAGRSVKCPKCRASVPIPASGGALGGAPGSGQAAFGGNGQAGYASALPSVPTAQRPGPNGYASPPAPGPAAYAGAPSAAQTNFSEDGDIPAHLKDRVQRELSTNEKIIWMGKPVPSIIFTRSLGHLVVGCVIGAFAMYCFTTANGAAVGACALLVALCVMAVPVYRWNLAEHTCYALTNRRAIVLKQGMFGLAREAYSPAEVAHMQRNDCFGSDAGDLVFHQVTTVQRSYSNRYGFSQSVNVKRYGFLAVEKVERVERLVRETLIDRFIDKMNEANNSF